ncbi:cyclic lactone autoinducer peptide [Lacrimispora algidixylanolytica]|jgi:cyclic lactone autoinducer peptide|uniref:Cyclic lactone autoinducer peptide n=1 Tax=Lacrimispora algidixylanolytica TaxID=94868 RepID=A0A419T027_9FIRM|nr:cyclic lactone autoinducer peptide [Lacrimispora algidixylanolytica]RKD30812.1 cyclic lactone autoinducer peptide [Lacrimispora algidixylanolytica]
MKSKTNNAAKFMEKLARKSLEVAAESRCMYIYHQPKMPTDLKKFKK